MKGFFNVFFRLFYPTRPYPKSSASESEDSNTSALYKKILAANYTAPSFITDSVKDSSASLQMPPTFVGSGLPTVGLERPRQIERKCRSLSQGS